MRMHGIDTVLIDWIAPYATEAKPDTDIALPSALSAKSSTDSPRVFG
ncbi:hypothetical protein MMMDOFMJ_0696 [Methylobacterium gnaphalii]|nr:hypothetical protein MMMDOFMJ_0696 [Methylobacterium gnaphalii]